MTRYASEEFEDVLTRMGELLRDLVNDYEIVVVDNTSEETASLAADATEGFSVECVGRTVLIGGFNRVGGTSASIWRSIDDGATFTRVSTTDANVILSSGPGQGRDLRGCVVDGVFDAAA